MLANMIKLNSILKKVNLSGNEMGQVTGEELIKVINHNDTIELLDVSNNHIEVKQLQYLKRKCDYNKRQSQKQVLPKIKHDLEGLQGVPLQFLAVKKKIERAEKQQIIQ